MATGSERELAGAASRGTTASAPVSRWRRWAPDVLGLAWVLSSAAALLLPTLIHGANLHDPAFGDQGDQLMPWTMLVWTQVHHGHLPLWNPYSALGLPLAFNWMSAPFSLPTLVGYLLPLHLAFAAQIVTTLVVAGTGMYVLARVIGLGAMGCVFAAVAFELSGPFVEYLGWPIGSVMSWAGWLFAAALLVIRGRHRVGSISLFAAILAAAIYAGQPETLAQLLVALGVFVVVLLPLRARRVRSWRTVLPPTHDLIVAGIAGCALGAPLALPGVQLTLGSLNGVHGLVVFGRNALPLNDFLYATRGSYLGVVVVVLALSAAVALRHRPEVLAFMVVAVIMAGIAFAPPIMGLMNRLPYLGDAHWQRATLPMAVAAAVLAGMGLDLVARGASAAASRWMAVVFTLAGAALAVAFALGNGHLSQGEISVRAKNIAWGTGAAALGALVMGALALYRRKTNLKPTDRRRPARWAGPSAGALLLACESAFLVAAGAPIWSTGPTSLSSTPAILDVQTVVGSAVVGFGNSNCFPKSLGILQNDNIAYGVQELAVFDPMTPVAYFRAWRAATGEPGGKAKDWLFCPAVTSATIARLYGVSFVLEPRGARGPQGAIFDGYAGYSKLYRIPGAAPATLTPSATTGAWPGRGAPGRAVPVVHQNPAAWTLATDSSKPSVLRLRLTDVPGWHATIDGRTLTLHRFAGIMLQARVPPGRHNIELSYWPQAFTVGIVLAAAAASALTGAGILSWRRRLQRRTAVVGAPTSTKAPRRPRMWAASNDAAPRRPR